MKRFVWSVLALSGLLLTGSQARASWHQLGYSGYQPWWNIFAKRYKCLTPEEARLQKFWHDYYNALKCYYDDLDNIDWVAYYKNHGCQINGGGCGGYPGCCGRVNYAPVVVTPTISWAMPSQNAVMPGCGPMPMGGMPPCGPQGCPPGMMGGPPGMGMGGPPPGMMLPPSGMAGPPPGMMGPPPGMGMAGPPPGMMAPPPGMMPPGGQPVMMPPGPGY